MPWDTREKRQNLTTQLVYAHAYIHSPITRTIHSPTTNRNMIRVRHLIVLVDGSYRPVWFFVSLAPLVTRWQSVVIIVGIVFLRCVLFFLSRYILNQFTPKHDIVYVIFFSHHHLDFIAKRQAPSNKVHAIFNSSSHSEVIKTKTKKT